jgi:hypothetical protein
VNEPRIARAQLLAGHAEPPRGPRPKTFDDNVCAVRECMELPEALRILEVERDAALAAIEQVVRDTAAVENAAMPHRITAPGSSTLMTSAPTREHGRGKRAGQQARKIDDAIPFERN